MFDPTVYENLKVVIEGAVYDVDLSGDIRITGRKDIVDLATLSRTFSIQFMKNSVTAEMTLFADLHSFTEEKIRQNEKAGCEIEIIFLMHIKQEDVCKQMDEVLQEIWRGRPHVQQQLSYHYPRKNNPIQNRVSITFDRKITEDQIDDIPDLIKYTLLSIDALSKMIKS